MTGSPTHASTHLSTATRSAFKRYWKSDPAFSEAKLDAYREKRAEVSFQLDTSFLRSNILLKDDFPTDPNLVLDNDVHPLFRPANFITKLPLKEVRAKLEPALRLASQFITDDHALEWFATVRFATLPSYDDGELGTLVRQAEPFTKDQLDIVKKEVRELAGQVPLTFVSQMTLTPGEMSPDGAATQFQAQVLRTIGVPLAEIETSKQYGDPSRVMASILINIEYFNQAMWHHYYDTTPNQKRLFQFSLAAIILHELEYVWMGTCHPHTRFHGEPLVLPSDVIPEARWSWEQHVLGGRVHDHDLKGCVMDATTFASLFRTPRHKLSSLVPAAWVSRWFLKATWDNFAQLHASGALLPPTPDRDVSFVNTYRYCSTHQNVLCYYYVDGELASPGCCKLESCGATKPGIDTRWPADPKEFKTLLLSLLKRY